MTGDSVINPSAAVLVMTTEILRHMLYHGSELLGEVAWVVFDEIHYMSNKERGVVWEESIILLPKQIKMVFLSATVPNAHEIGLWVAKLHGQPVSIIGSNYRPTPLVHYVFPSGGKGLYLVKDGAKPFAAESFNLAMQSLEQSRGPGLFDKTEKSDRSSKGKGKGSGGADTGPDLFSLIKLLFERELQPVIVFCFAKKDCEVNALALADMDFSTAEQKVDIRTIFDAALAGLQDADRELGQLQEALPLLLRGTHTHTHTSSFSTNPLPCASLDIHAHICAHTRTHAHTHTHTHAGIGLHHGGLLPILKEVTELLFSERLLSVLLCTETFAMVSPTP
jgi:ATP-dependent RNA helicase DOB1